jgi:hypothetical protein
MGKVLVFFVVWSGTTVRKYFPWGLFPGYITGGIEKRDFDFDFEVN